MENGSVRFVNNSWMYVKRSVNMNNFTISYTQEGGFTTKKEAEKYQALDDAQYEIDLRRIKIIANMQYTFKEYIEYWAKNIFLSNTDTSTKTIGIWGIYHLILPNIRRDVLLNYVSVDYVNEIIENCIPVCDSAGETAQKFMKRILRDAYEYGYFSKDIRSEIVPVKRKSPKIKLLNKNDLKKIVQEASKHPGYYFEILLGLFAGLRTGEIRGLRYGDFDAEKQTVRISRQYTTNYNLSDSNDHFEYTCYMEEKKPKGSSYRDLKIPASLFDVLEKLKAFNESIIKNCVSRGQEKIDTEYVSLSVYGTRKTKNTLLASIHRVCKYAGVQQISFHTLRHQFATMLLEKGVPLEEISKLLGHKSVLTTFNVYCGIMDADEDTRKVIDVMIPYSERLHV